MASNALPPHYRLKPIDRWAGVATQFERTDGGYLFRRQGHGPAIRVTAAERDAFAAAGLRALLWHAGAMLLCGGAAGLLIRDTMGAGSDTLAAIVIGVVVSAIAMVLYRSQRWFADAPARALAGRPVERPALDPGVGAQPGYGTIIGAVLVLLFLAAIGTKQPGWIYVTFATMAVMGGLFVAAMRWSSDSRLAPAQRERARVERQRVKARDRADASWGKALLLLLFLLIETVLLVGAILLAVGAVGAIAGKTSNQMTFGLFMVGFVAGMALGGLLIWPLERLCKRWTGDSAMDILSFIPAGW